MTKNYKAIQNLFFILVVGVSFLQAQEIQSPDEYLGYKLGSKFTPHHKAISYFKYVSDRMPNQLKLESYGQTYEGRPLYYAVLSSAQNISQLQRIRKSHLEGINNTKAENDKAIVWLSYNVHGNEASSTEAALKTLYILLTKKQSWLSETIVIIDPCLNPDGRDRYVHWFTENASIPYDSSPNAAEHYEPWPGGRANHYMHDLNRDWAWITQIESQQRLKIYQKWLPHIHVDFHEQGYNSPYYFAPAAEPFHEIITDWQQNFQTEIGKNHARYFDDKGWLYFTRESFDLLYPSYGDTYPTYLGAIGMTYEQAGNGTAGLGILTDENKILTLTDRIEHHTTTGLSTIEVAYKNRAQLNTEFVKFFDNQNIETKTYAVRGPKEKINHLKNLLSQHQIKFGSNPGTKISGFDYELQKKSQWTLTATDLVVPATQPRGKMVKVLLEPKTQLSDSLTYDITAWGMGYAHGLNTMSSKQKVTLKPFQESKTSIVLSANEFGYALKWDNMDDAKFLAALFKHDFQVRVSKNKFHLEDETMGAGALIILKRDQYNQKIDTQKLSDLAQKYNQTLIPIRSGFSKNPPDLGSSDVRLLKKPKIGIIKSDHVSSYSFGALWHFFEQQLGYPVTHLNKDRFSNIPLHVYQVLIFPSGSYADILKNNDGKKIMDWVQQGGTLIAIGNAVGSFASDEKWGVKSMSHLVENEESKSNLQPYQNRERQYIKNLITGAVFKTKVDNTHPLAYGYTNAYYSLKLSSASYQLLENGYNVAYLPSSSEPISGFVGSEAKKKIQQSLVFGHLPKGAGNVVYLVDDVLFRNFWENGKLFLVNGLFLLNTN